jgi:hypothetical protein
MKNLILTLFSLVALLGLVLPSSFVHAVTLVKRETNAERLARGLPPNPPTRRSTARHHRQSPSPPLLCVHFHFLLSLAVLVPGSLYLVC